MNALQITSGAELTAFEPRPVRLDYREYAVLTGYETEPNTCWWCGAAVPNKNGRSAHYCRKRSRGDFESCFRLYWNHFEWGSASAWAMKRAGNRCENCGVLEAAVKLRDAYSPLRTNLEVHHIVPVCGQPRFFSAWNLPWNLIVLCLGCHLDAHAAMRGMERLGTLTVWEYEQRRGQVLMEGILL